MPSQKGHNVRIHDETWEKLRKIAFDNRTTIADLIDKATELLQKEDNK